MIAAEGEHKASRALRHAADVISENPAALQVETMDMMTLMMTVMMTVMMMVMKTVMMNVAGIC